MNRNEIPEWLLSVWSRVLVEAGSPCAVGEIARLGTKLLERWTNPARHFHGLSHLIMVLEKIDELSQEASCPSLVRLAAFYHGAILATGAGPLERHAWSEDTGLSADLARGQLRHLELAEDIADRVSRLITGLKTRPTGGIEPDLAVLRDSERAILAADPRAYRSYVAALRAECAGASPATVLPARVETLRRWLSQDRLFVTSGTTAWEDAARHNIAAELCRAERELAALNTPVSCRLQQRFPQGFCF
jgi:predicted metal-dependent HD superfamily phosphohydrolase